MTVKELYETCLNIADNTWVNLMRGNENIDCMYMKDLLKRYGDSKIEWFESYKNNMYDIEVRL